MPRSFAFNQYLANGLLLGEDKYSNDGADADTGQHGPSETGIAGQATQNKRADGRARSVQQAPQRHDSTAQLTLDSSLDDDLTGHIDTGLG